MRSSYGKPQEKYFKTLLVHNFLSYLHFFEVDEISSKYGYLILPGVFPDEFTPDIDLIDEAVVQCYVPVVKILL